MREKLPLISGKEFIRLLEKSGFTIIRINGSHYRRKHPDGRITTIPVHKNEHLPKGLLRKILREDIKMTPEELKISSEIFNVEYLFLFQGKAMQCNKEIVFITPA